MRIRGQALISKIQSVPNYLNGEYAEVAWAVFRLIREEGNTVEFPDILVALDDLRHIDTPDSRGLKMITKLAESCRRRDDSVQIAERLPDLDAVEILPSPPPSTSLGSDFVEVDLGGSSSGSLALIDDPPPRPRLVLPKVDPPLRGMKLLAAMGSEERIRFYVEHASNKGHQSSTVTIARKLIDWMFSSLRSQNVNLKLVFEFLCKSEDALGKAKSIIGGPKLCGIPCEFTLCGKSKLKPVKYTLSGAIDRPEVMFDELATECLIGLQPFGWAGAVELAMCKGKKPIVLTLHGGLDNPKCPLKLPMEFRRMPFVERPSGSSSSSSSSSSGPDAVVLDFLQRARSSTQSLSSSSLPVYICPIYGMGTGQPMSDHSRHLWMNLISTLVVLLERKEFLGNIILLNVSRDLGPDAAGTWGRLIKSFEGDRRIAIIAEAITSLVGVERVFSLFGSGARLAVCTATGDKSQSVMDSVYRDCRLPPIFEGQGSLTQVLSMGRPFIKFSMRAWTDKNWPSDYLPCPGFEKVDAEIQEICNTIVEDWTKVGGGDKCQALARLMWEMFKPSSEVCAYFAACEQIVTNLSFDRLAWVAEALALLDS